MKKITVSAPGKLMLFGEHAVVYDRSCLVTAVDSRITVEIKKIDQQEVKIDAPQVKINGYQRKLSVEACLNSHKGVRFIEAAIEIFRKRYGLVNGLKIKVENGFSSNYGLGSSSAISVCIVKALAEIFSKKLGCKQIFNLAYKAVLNVQGVGSGFDVGAACWGGTLFYTTGGKKIVPLKAERLPLVIAYSGNKADTPTLIRKVQKLRLKRLNETEKIFDKIEKIVKRAKKKLQEGKWEELGELMTKNHELLVKLGVSTPKIEKLISAALSAGAFGAKISGAGGGDCIIVLAGKEKHHLVEQALVKAGGALVPVETGAEGVRREI